MLRGVSVLSAAFLQRNPDAFCEAFGVDDRYLMELHQRKQRGPCRVALRVMVMED